MASYKPAKWPFSAKTAKMIFFDKTVQRKTLAEFKEQQLKQNNRLYKDFSDEQFKKMQDDYYTYAEKFLGCCKVGDEVSIIENEYKNELIFSKDWQGTASDHTDLLLTLFLVKDNWFSLKSSFICEISHLGTLSTLPDSIESKMGQKVGSSRIQHSDGKYTMTLQNNELTLIGGVFRKYKAIFLIT